MAKEFLYKQECYLILGAVFEVHKQLGCGFLEKVYQEALEVELKVRGIPYEREKQIKINYKGIPLQTVFYADFVCYGRILLELKAVEALTAVHEAQVHNYLRAAHFDVGYLINFNEEYIDPIRISYSETFKANLQNH